MAILKIACVQLPFISLLVFICAAKQNCSKTQCKVLPVGENLASEFQSKASEKGVRMVYLNLEIGNDSYHPLELKDVFFPERWVWADSITEPMLRLPYDFDILSLGLLNYQVRSMTVPLEDHPSGCLASLHSSHQNLAVGRTLLNNVTRGSPSEVAQETEVVCVQTIEKDHDSDESSVKYLCCGTNTTLIRCDLRVESSNWFGAMRTVLGLLSVFLLFYSPMPLLFLPDCIFSLKKECDKEDNRMTNTENVQNGPNADNTRDEYERLNGENEEQDTLEDSESEESAELAVDDASPITCSTLLLAFVQRLPELRMSFTIKLAFLLFAIVPFVVYVQLGLYITFKNEYFKKVPPGTSLVLSEFSSDFANMKSSGNFFIFTLWVLGSLGSVLFLRPKDLILHMKQDALHEMYCTITGMVLPTAPLHNIGDVMLFHLKVLLLAVPSSIVSRLLRLQMRGLKKLFCLATCSVPRETNRGLSRKWLAFRVLWVLLLMFPVLIVGLTFGAIVLLLNFVTVVISLFVFSPFSALIFGLLVNIWRAHFVTRQKKIVISLKMVFTALCVFVLMVLFFFLISSSCSFIVGILGFTIMGLVLNAEIVTPYVAFLIVLATNICLCYANLQNRYKEIKRYILQYRRQNASQTTSSDQSTIPTKLFWIVCDRVFPVKTEVCLMVCKMTAIVVFLFLVISSIVFFRNLYNISAVVSTIYVFVSGAIPGLVLDGLTKGEKFSGWAKIKLEREIKKAVDEFYRENGNGDNINSD